MHEYSIVDSLIQTCLKIAKDNNANGIETIYIKLGERANIDKALLFSAFENFKLEFDELKNCNMDVEMQEIILHCKDCDNEFHSLDNPICPKCDSKETQILHGRDIQLHSLSLFL